MMPASSITIIIDQSPHMKAYTSSVYFHTWETGETWAHLTSIDVRSMCHENESYRIIHILLTEFPLRTPCKEIPIGRTHVIMSSCLESAIQLTWNFPTCCHYRNRSHSFWDRHIGTNMPRRPADIVVHERPLCCWVRKRNYWAWTPSLRVNLQHWESLSKSKPILIPTFLDRNMLCEQLPPH